MKKKLNLGIITSLAFVFLIFIIDRIFKKETYVLRLFFLQAILAVAIAVLLVFIYLGFKFKYQKGILPRALLIIGMVSVLFSGVILILLSDEPKPIFLVTLELPGNTTIRILFFIIAILLFFLGMYLANIYPRILLTRAGLHYLGFMFYYGQLRWNEIDDLIKLKNGTILVLIKPKRFFLFKGMIFQRLTGVLLGHKCPVLLLAPGFELRDRIIQEIMANGLVKEVHRFGDPGS